VTGFARKPGLSLGLDGGSDGPTDRTVVDVTFADWRLVVVGRGETAGYDVRLTNPGAASPYESRWRDSAIECVEKATDYMRTCLGAPKTARKLRELALEALR
jgi:hypothetical protein